MLEAVESVVADVLAVGGSDSAVVLAVDAKLHIEYSSKA
jgi:hypothetical protein